MDLRTLDAIAYAALAQYAVWCLVVAWWAARWGRDVALAVIGSLALTPFAWAMVLIALGRAEATEAAGADRQAASTAGPKVRLLCGSCHHTYTTPQATFDAGEAKCPACGEPAKGGGA